MYFYDAESDFTSDDASYRESQGDTGRVMDDGEGVIGAGAIVAFKRPDVVSDKHADQYKQRFQVELEFVQCLGNPNYLNFLAQRGYFRDNSFIDYLKYLLYWKEPEYARFLRYPMCLHFLDLLQDEHFRRELVNKQCSKFIDDQQILVWQHCSRQRSRLLTPASTNESQNSGPANTEHKDTNL